MARRSDNTRKELKEMAIHAGLALVEEAGIEALSARQIAARIGYTVGTLYNLFDDFEDIVLHLNAATLRAMYATLKPLAATSKKPLVRLHDLARGYCDYAQSNPARWTLLHSHPRSAPLPQWFHEEVEGIFALVEAPLRELTAGKPPEIRDAAKVLWAGLHGICALGLSQKLARVEGGSMHALVENFVQHYVKGLMGQR